MCDVIQSCVLSKALQKWKDNSINSKRLNQWIINMSRNENFCKGTRVSKVIAETKVDARVEQWKKFTGLANLLWFGKFAVFWVLWCGITCKRVLFPYHRFIVLLACIDRWKVYNWLVFACTVKTVIKVKRLCVLTSKNGTLVELLRFSVFFVRVRRK